jgi:hypothetical protein
MIVESIDRHAGKSDCTIAGFGFGTADDSAGAGYFRCRSPDPDGAMNKIDISARQGEQFAGAQAAKPGQNHQCPQSRADGVGRLKNRVGVDNRPLLWALDSGAADLAGVAGDPHVLDGGVENGPEEPVRLGGLIPPRRTRSTRNASCAQVPE